MGGATPATFAQGLLSGLGHPIIGLDHLAFLLSIGLAIGVGGLSLLMPAIFVGASAIGLALHVHGVALPATESVLAGSLLIAGAMLARGARFGSVIWASLFSLAGLFHGYAFGESIVGAEPTPLAAYLLGLVMIQILLTTATALVIRRQGASGIVPASRLVGAAICGVGVAVLGGSDFADHLIRPGWQTARFEDRSPAAPSKGALGIRRDKLGKDHPDLAGTL
jgi:urease accessory protein